MKNCLLCGTVSPDDAATCPACGEASWGRAADGAFGFAQRAAAAHGLDIRLGTEPSVVAEDPKATEPMFTRTDDRRSKRGRR